MSNKKKTVLIVDDNHDAADSLAVLVEARGHYAITAYDTATGLDLAIQVNPDIIIHDIGLPITDGYAAAAQLRTNRSFHKTLLIALTGYVTTVDRQRSKLAGFDLHISKPLELEMLDEVLALPQRENS